jgi:hypothetical protein
MEHFKIMLNKAVIGFLLMITPFIDVIEQWVRISAGILGCLLTIFLIRQGIVSLKVKREELKIRKLERKAAEQRANDHLKKI